MGDQQGSSLEELKTLAINAKFGDGYFWRHPECINYKVIYTSTTKEILKAKMKILPSIFPSGISLYRKAGYVKGVTNNAKPLYKLTSLVHPVFTKYANYSKTRLIKYLKIKDFALWYLDDGCCIHRTGNSYRFFLCIGDTCKTQKRKLVFENKIKELFDNKIIGTIKKNNSKATENNKNWVIPVPIAKVIINEAQKYCFINKKFPYGKPSETIRKGVGN